MHTKIIPLNIRFSIVKKIRKAKARSSRPEVFCKKGVVRNFGNFFTANMRVK